MTSHPGQRNHFYRHGKTGTPTWWSWNGMLKRCNQRNNSRYKNYGGRGIRVCKRWLRFENFLADMGERPVGMTLDRKNPNKGYSKTNCRWATKLEQARNTTRTKLNVASAMQIRWLRSEGGFGATEIANAFNISSALVRRVVNGAIWRLVE